MKTGKISVIVSCVSLVFSCNAIAATYYVALTGDNTWSGSSVYPWRTLQYAADRVSAGDTVHIRTGSYRGFRAKSSGSSGLPITFKSENGATVVLNETGPDAWHGSIVEIEGYHWWELEDLEVTGAPSSAGIDVRLADHVIVKHCYCHHNQKWGIFTAFAENFTAQYNECSYSSEEHGIYHSNSGDNAILSYNTCHHNSGCGIQINADPSMGGDGISSNNKITHNTL